MTTMVTYSCLNDNSFTGDATPVGSIEGGEIMAVRKIGRSAITGRFVKKSTVARHPKTTVTQTVRGKKR